MNGLDPQILQDFLTESGELLGALETDLVELERTPDDPEMVNRVFRALHTIKGSASFLSLTNLVTIAHAAESALNAARNRQAIIDRPFMDRLLAVVDLLKVQFEQVAGGQDLTEPDPELVRVLKLIGDGKQSSLGDEPGEGPAPTHAENAAPDDAGDDTSPLELPPGKAELAEFMIADTAEGVSKIRSLASILMDPAARAQAAADLVETADALSRSVDFFGLATMTELTRALQQAAEAARSAGFAGSPGFAARVSACALLLSEHADCLQRRRVLGRSAGTLAERLSALASGHAPGEGFGLESTIDEVFAADGVAPGSGPEAHRSPDPADAADHPANAPQREHEDHEPAAQHAPRAAAGEPARKPDDAKKGAAPAGEQTIRVEVGRLETLMNLVGELVLQKNRLQALVRRAAQEPALPGHLRESLTAAGGGLDRVTGDMQAAVLRTRMQPLDKLFGKYPRLIRDLASKTGKKIDLIIEGGETEVDKSVIEELGDPLVHLMRNAADHGLEPPAERLANGKPEGGTITLSASNEGGHVRVLVRDDGRGLSRERIGRKAVERGMITPEALAQMSDRDVYRFIFAAGFSTADQVSDLSGRGVGMDVVRTNIENLKGTIDLDSVPGKGATVAITIPLTVAIMPAMMVGVASEIYAVPLSSITEIVRPEQSRVMTIGEHPVLRLRDEVLPLVRAAEVFGLPDHRMVASPFAVILSMNGKRVGLMVTRLIGQQEIVIKSLDGLASRQGAGVRGPIAGATVRDDGNVSLIVDVAELFRLAETRPARAAA